MVHYIAGYADPANVFNRKCSLAGVAKMDYIIRCLREFTPCVIYSTTQRKGRQHAPAPDGVTYRCSIASQNKYGYYLDLLLAIVQLLAYLLRIPASDTVLVYHERWYMPWVCLAHRLKGWKLVYEVEEIYCAVARRPQKEIDHETAQLRQADAYLFSTRELAEALSIHEAPHAIVNGVYTPVFANQKTQDGKTHIIYAGSLNRAKGAWIAIEAMKELPADIILHVCGAGSPKDIDYIRALIRECNVNNNIIYEGCLPEEAHLALLQACEIGLCPANPAAAFPSKILEYMRNGLKVISVRKPEIESAACSRFLYYFEENDIAGFRAAVLKAMENSAQGQAQGLLDMHRDFVSAFNDILRHTGATA